MKTIFSDLETRWTVTLEPTRESADGQSHLKITITNPETGESHHDVFPSHFGVPDIADWLRSIPRHPDPEKDYEIKLKDFLHRTYPEMAAGARAPEGPLSHIKLTFAQTFGFWGISLAEDVVAHRRRGKICKAGWVVWYLFGSDGQGEYLDYYSAHRMTGDCHTRLYENGRREDLPSLCEFCLCSDDPEEDARLKAAFYEKNRKVAAMLETKGFGIFGDEPGLVQMNRYLVTQGLDGQ
jgi:hypothetical protein